MRRERGGALRQAWKEGSRESGDRKYALVMWGC